MKTLSFPDDMRSPFNEDKPYVKIEVQPEVGTELAKGENQVCLFMPDDVGVSTATNYGDAEIGAGRALENIMKNGSEGLNKTDVGVIIQGLSGLIPGSERFSTKERLALKQKAIFNPQAVTLLWINIHICTKECERV